MNGFILVIMSSSILFRLFVFVLSENLLFFEEYDAQQTLKGS